MTLRKGRHYLRWGKTEVGGRGHTSEGVRPCRGASPSKQISNSVVPKLHLSAAVLRPVPLGTHSGAIQGIRSTLSGGQSQRSEVLYLYPAFRVGGH